MIPLINETILIFKETAELLLSESENEKEGSSKTTSVNTTYSCDICTKEFTTKLGLYGHKGHHTVKANLIFIYN